MKIPALNDSRYVGMSVYNVVILSVVGVPAALMIEQAQDISFALTAFFVIFTTTVTLCLVFVPKVRDAVSCSIRIINTTPQAGFHDDTLSGTNLLLRRGSRHFLAQGSRSFYHYYEHEDLPTNFSTTDPPTTVLVFAPLD